MSRRPFPQTIPSPERVCVSAESMRFLGVEPRNRYWFEWLRHLSSLPVLGRRQMIRQSTVRPGLAMTSLAHRDRQFWRESSDDNPACYLQDVPGRNRACKPHPSYRSLIYELEG